MADDLPTGRCGTCPSLHLRVPFLAERDRRSSNLCLADALCRRPGPAVSKCDRGSLTAPRLAPARVTQSSTSFEVEDCEAASAYFFFRRLVFFAPFFAAAFAFVFRFFAMLPS